MKQRIITAVIAAAVFLPIVVYGNFPFVILMFLMATIGLHELFKMHKISAISPSSIIGFLMLWILLIPTVYSSILEDFSITKTTTFMIGAVLLLIYTVTSKNRFTFDDVGFVLISVLYVAMGFYYIMETRADGLFYVFFVLFTLWATDSGAYFIGRAIGKNKLWPEISPNKTIEGALGGVCAALLVALLFSIFTSIDENLVKLLLMSVVIAIFGQLGDLVQSAFKRHYGVKDSGNLLPGHGGILDRTDSWLFVFPILHLIHLI
ncbi:MULTISPECIES: phosphatidate cytidylyltransferase [Bacillus]|uniref:phosphatidate cytidylyltransferase n=1 Tax=Bacillus TaxID=1386 RepID=UPI000309309B|nr:MULTISPECIES: phosphatidate cytidylyltransferase [Bacillus]